MFQDLLDIQFRILSLIQELIRVFKADVLFGTSVSVTEMLGRKYTPFFPLFIY